MCPDFHNLWKVWLPTSLGVGGFFLLPTLCARRPCWRVSSRPPCARNVRSGLFLCLRASVLRFEFARRGHTDLRSTTLCSDLLRAWICTGSLEIAARALLGVAKVLEITVRRSLGVLSAHRSKSQTKSLFEVTSLCLSTRLHFTRLQHCSVHVYARVHTSIYIYIYILYASRNPAAR